jgi:hypothetical protein
MFSVELFSYILIQPQIFCDTKKLKIYLVSYVVRARFKEEWPGQSPRGLDKTEI